MSDLDSGLEIFGNRSSLVRHKLSLMEKTYHKFRTLTKSFFTLDGV
jgi:hypothetical protein